MASKGEAIYGLVCVCIQTYNCRIYGIEERAIKSISFALEILVQEFGPPDLITCDKEGAFQQLAKELGPKDIGAQEAAHQVAFKFTVANCHFSTGLVERNIKTIHNYIGKLKMQGSGMTVTDMSLMFQYVAFQINSIPYGVRNINSYSQAKMQKLREAPELISFIRSADWMMFSCPKGIDFKSLQNNKGNGVKDAMDKLNILTKVRTHEILKVVNDQYKNACLESSNKLKVNSVVLLKTLQTKGNVRL